MAVDFLISALSGMIGWLVGLWVLRMLGWKLVKVDESGKPVEDEKPWYERKEPE